MKSVVLHHDNYFSLDASVPSRLHFISFPSRFRGTCLPRHLGTARSGGVHAHRERTYAGHFRRRSDGYQVLQFHRCVDNTSACCNGLYTSPKPRLLGFACSTVSGKNQRLHRGRTLHEEVDGGKNVRVEIRSNTAGRNVNAIHKHAGSCSPDARGTKCLLREKDPRRVGKNVKTFGGRKCRKRVEGRLALHNGCFRPFVFPHFFHHLFVFRSICLFLFLKS